MAISASIYGVVASHFTLCVKTGMMSPNERAALFIAPPIAPLAFTTALAFPRLLQGTSDFFVSVLIVTTFGIPIAYGIALCLGLPLYLLARKYHLVNFWSLSLGGAFVATLPTLLTLIFLYDSWLAGRDWRVHGVFGITGFVVGAVFWYVLRLWPNLPFKRVCRKSAAAR